MRPCKGVKSGVVMEVDVGDKLREAAGVAWGVSTEGNLCAHGFLWRWVISGRRKRER